MRIILVRHGEKRPTPGLPESAWPLQPFARKQVEGLREQLECLGFAPACGRCIRYQHAVDTAVILVAGREANPVLAVTGLTPFTDERAFTLAAMLGEAEEKGLQVAEASTVALVGHHPRVSQLAQALTGSELPELARPEAVVLADSSLTVLKNGKAWIERRCLGERPALGGPNNGSLNR